MKGLILDDERDAVLCFHRSGNQIYLQTDWDIVKNIEEFQNYIFDNGLPKVISFDHDLNDTHYKEGADYNWTYFNHNKFNDTGYHALLWLFEYIRSKNTEVPKILIHTANPFASGLMNKLVKNFKK